MQQWLQYLQTSHNAHIENNAVSDFGNPSAERQALVNDTVLCDLSHIGLLELSGADRLAFVQGQVTNDIKLLNGNNAHYSGYCNPKGRLLALFTAFSHHDHLHLQMPRELIEPISKRLKMYVMRSKVEIKDVSESITKIGIHGKNATELLKPLFAKIPQNNYEFVTLENGALLKLPGVNGADRFEIFTQMDIAKTVWESLKQHTQLVGVNGWEWLEIQAGIPTVALKTQEEFVPQMLNLDALGAINYKKGCYTGQEIVARTHYLGKVKRRTQLAHVTSDTAPAIGDDVLDNNQQAIGKIVRCAPAIDGGFDVLAESRLEALESGIFWKNAALKIKTLPYDLA